MSDQRGKSELKGYFFGNKSIDLDLGTSISSKSYFFQYLYSLADLEFFIHWFMYGNRLPDETENDSDPPEISDKHWPSAYRIFLEKK